MSEIETVNKAISAEVKKLKNILENHQIKIPVYQRPYRWDEKNVLLLLNDIHEAWQSGKQSYRIGALILHKESIDSKLRVNFNLVDGQQRITTLLLILHLLDSQLVKPHIHQLVYSHIDSRQNIRQNHAFISKWVENHIADRKTHFLIFLIEQCEMVEIIVEDLSEAFQMFDAQNGRGKELKAYNLLKAYHIRAMDEEEQNTKIKLDQRWENSTRIPTQDGEIKDVLNQIVSEQLYRTRLWIRQVSSYAFTKQEIDEFKGVSIKKNDYAEHPFHNIHYMLLLARTHLEQIGGNVKGIKNRFAEGFQENIDPFVRINQEFINGKFFFDYIETYNQIYQRLFLNLSDKNELSLFKEFYQSNCLYKQTRAGDRYLCEVYKSLLFLCFDKFGEEGLMLYYITLYGIIYRMRLERKHVKYDFLAKDKSVMGTFSALEQAKNYTDLIHLEAEARKPVALRKPVDAVERFFIQQGIELIK